MTWLGHYFWNIINSVIAQSERIYLMSLVWELVRIYLKFSFDNKVIRKLIKTTLI